MRTTVAAILLVPLFAGVTGCQAAAAGLAGFSNGYNGGGGSYARPAAPSPPTADSCTSDYECTYGSHCVKRQFETEGYCAQETDQSGVPTYSPPSPASIGPGAPDQCRFDTDCPVGWSCDKGTGLTGTCVK